jgi:mono/diheme cytochrome c family protein
MRSLPKILSYALLILFLLAVAGISTTIGWRPFLGAKARKLTPETFAASPERLTRGRYLAESITGCLGCHSPHDWIQHDAPIPAGKEGSGELMPIGGLPGTIYAPNLTSDPDTGAGRWSDDQLARAIREGIGHDGRALFPLMPYQNFRALSDEDLASIIVFLRTLPPVRNPLPQSQIIFPVKYLIRGAPEPLAGAVPQPDLSTPLKRGAYLTEIANCAVCHTPQVRGAPIAGMDFAGGFILDGPWGRVASANITPDASGISYYDEELFIQTLRTGYVHTRKLSSIMPWHEFRNMTDEDLAAIFAYLRTVKPVSHRVDNTENPTYCRICKTVHGFGDKN